MKAVFFIATAVCFSVFAKKSITRDPAAVERPPQFVLLAFDGSSSLDMWRDTVDFASQVKTSGTGNASQNVKFTYFINPTYYTELPYKSNYMTPLLNKSVSCIGWASPAGSVLNRIKATDRAFTNGHEIGSHANSHCSADGKGEDPLKGMTWTEEHWNSEFDQFNHLLFNSLSNNKIQTDYLMQLKQENILGFRAPALAVTAGLWPTLQNKGFRYDTSRIDNMTYWPQKMNWGGWNIPLAMLKIPGSTKTTLSMDYNWFVFHTAGESLRTESECKLTENKEKKWCKAAVFLTPERVDQFKNQMLDSYKFYFKKNYFGNRAPVQIGHHFSSWNGGAYWKAMKEFTQFVCNKPEVKCVTMVDYVKWLESNPASVLAAYRKGDFAKLPDDGTIKDIALGVDYAVRLDSGDGKFEVMTDPEQKNKINEAGLKKQLSIDFKPYKQSSIENNELKKIVNGKSALVRASLVNKRGTEVSWQTYRVENIGTVQQNVIGPIEDAARLPETADAHREDF